MIGRVALFGEVVVVVGIGVAVGNAGAVRVGNRSQVLVCVITIADSDPV